jgi:hypothetical protein
MAKAIKATITLPHGLTVKADKLSDRTIRTVKVGDYLPSTLEVRGTLCAFYGRVTSVQGDVVRGVFGSYDMPFSTSVGKGARVDVYRPIPA